MRFRFGEYGGRYNSSMPSDAASALTTAHFWYRALSSTSVIGPRRPAAATSVSSVQTLSALIYAWFDPRIPWCVIASSAASTLYRLRPDGPGTNSRTTHHRYPRNGP